MLLISFKVKLFLLRIFYFFNITFDIYIEIIFGDNIQDLFYAEIYRNIFEEKITERWVK